MNKQTKYNQTKWRCRRGMLELDLLLNGFVNHVYPTLESKAQKSFETLLDCPDQSLQQWLAGNDLPDDKSLHDIVKQIRLNACHSA
ncbi:MAG: succinate dehydrogenase assembly factor 2 [Methylococcales bacterium]|jgi:antitoxin CptB|nr:succinate dehydrogenase assembly factor 2 [Methylococcales bacterium]